MLKLAMVIDRRSSDYTNLEKGFDNLTGKRLIGRKLGDIKKYL